MLAADLTSAVFILRPQTTFAPRQFLGRMAHRIFLLILNHTGYDALATALHDQNGVLPYTVSDLFTNGQTHFWMRVTGLTPSMSAALQEVCHKIAHQTLDVPPRDPGEVAWTFTLDAALLSHHDWSRSVTYGQFIQDTWKLRKPRQLSLEFVTPTLIKSVGVQRPFPMPGTIFRLLYERLSKLENIKLPFQPHSLYVDTFAEYYLEISDYEIDCVTRLPVKNETATCFCGWISYRVLAKNEDFRKRAETAQRKSSDESLAATYTHIDQNHEAYVRLIHLLGQFAFFSGVGKYTGQGMGMVRLIDQPTR